MRKSRFSDEQMVAILRKAEQTSVAETAKKRKVGEQTIYLWRKRFAGMAPADIKRLKDPRSRERQAQAVACGSAISRST